MLVPASNITIFFLMQGFLSEKIIAARMLEEISPVQELVIMYLTPFISSALLITGSPVRTPCISAIKLRIGCKGNPSIKYWRTEKITANFAVNKKFFFSLLFFFIFFFTREPFSFLV